MKNTDFSKNSWHYKIATFVGYRPPSIYDYDKEDWVEAAGDICSYSRYVLIAILLFTLLAVVCIIFVNAIIHMLLGLAFSIFYGVWMVNDLGAVTLFVTASFAVYSLCYYLVKNIAEYINKKRAIEYHSGEPSKPGFIKQAYRSWKDKYCAKITFTEK